MLCTFARFGARLLNGGALALCAEPKGKHNALLQHGKAGACVVMSTLCVVRLVCKPQLLVRFVAVWQRRGVPAVERPTFHWDLWAAPSQKVACSFSRAEWVCGVLACC